MPEYPTRTVACPTCDESVAVSVPRSADDLTVTADPDPGLDDHVETRGRSRRIELTCSAGHALHVYFDW